MPTYQEQVEIIQAALYKLIETLMGQGVEADTFYAAVCHLNIDLIMARDSDPTTREAQLEEFIKAARQRFEEEPET